MSSLQSYSKQSPNATMASGRIEDIFATMNTPYDEYNGYTSYTFDLHQAYLHIETDSYISKIYNLRTL